LPFDTSLLIIILFYGLHFRKQKTAFIGWVGERMSHNLMFRVESVELPVTQMCIGCFVILE